ncbi:MAG TPA: transposase [Terracidiphilus sp.]|nr:transposase [Terracidiphilus sp.]
MTEGKYSELNVARDLRLEAGTILAVDRGYNDYVWFGQLTGDGIFFVTRMKTNTVYTTVEVCAVPEKGNVLSDQIVSVPSLGKDGEAPVLFRRIEYWNADKQEILVFFTNLLHLAAATVAAIYKDRWQIGVSSQGHINQPVQVRPRLTDSSLVAWEASWNESETMRPSDNMLRKEYAQLTRLQRAVNVDVASLHANPEAETVDNVRKQQELTEMSPMRRLSPAGYQRRHGEKENVATGEALGARRRNLVEEATAITASGKCRRRRQGGGSGRTTVDGRAAKRARREGPGPVSIPFDKVRQG